MESANEFIDISFDSEFESNKIFPWYPWIGKDYSISSKKLLILGESTYNWSKNNEDRKKTQERINKNDHLRILHKNHAMNPKSNAPFTRNIERALFLNKSPEFSKIKKLWLSVAYHNLVLSAMPTIKHRPHFNDYKHGWVAFLELTILLNIDECLVYGLELKKIKSFLEVLRENNIEYAYSKIKPGVGRSYPRIIYFNYQDREVKMLFIRHPSAFFSWKKWGNIIKEKLSISLAL